ncbi:sigma-70 family RNA polymerase sigma factor [Streptomyces triculaminicus]|uniref:Sigma-70 family RNA polymerase sigma factor n=3 Tax=Streptomyces TaxID=1883 RepID=A0A939FQH8_9ACTN|nr:MULTISPECIES: sigma-70 family RNA polymerase sigma factor [Streptomyces]MBO0656285.1 sigma-70 family RNA polymerase sigma factor [Streptomyces triculaminicus]QSY50267.1 sigma-70 family RNA polymerase sigma factor [Streptomyces griseocarneus]
MAEPTPRPSARDARGHDGETADTAEVFTRLAALPPGPERDRLRQDVIAAWLPMAERVSMRFRKCGESPADLRQVAALALVHAVDRYDPRLGHAFESFAIPTINGELKRHVRDHVWSLHIPRRDQELRAAVRAAAARLEQLGAGSDVTVAELAAETGLSEEEVRRGLDADGVHHTLSLDHTVAGSDELPLADTLGRCDRALELVIDRQSLKPLLDALPEREKYVLYWRFFGNLTQQQIGARLGVSQMQISRILSRTCARLRRQLLAAA